MPDLDLTQPLPDRAHEAIRVAVLGAIDDLRLNVDDIQSGFELTDMLFQFIGELMGAVDGLTEQVTALNWRDDANEIRDRTAQDGIDGMQVQMAALIQRVEALEADGLGDPDPSG